MDDANTLISVIIPVYKVEAYLDRCVESVVRQTYRNLEIILVDDGSPDNCPQLCDEWAKRDERIRVIHKENGGLSDARNAGLAVAQGEYIGFVDSDDWIHSQMYETLYKALKKTNADIVECKLQKYTSEFPQQQKVASEFPITEYQPERALECLLNDKIFHQTTVNKLYKRTIIRNIPFPVGKVCEDEYWTYQVIGASKQLASIDEVLYYYYQREGSIIHTYNLKRLDCLEALELRMDYMRQRFPSLYPLASKSYLSACFFHYQMLCRYHSVDPDGSEKRKLHQRFISGDFNLLLSQANAKYKLWYRMFRYFPNVTCKIRNLLNIGL